MYSFNYVKPTSLKEVGEFLGKLPVPHLLIVCDRANESCPRIFGPAGNPWLERADYILKTSLPMG